MGAQNVMISMAGDGGYLLTQDHVYHAKAAVGTAVNSVGAGDSMIAGFVVLTLRLIIQKKASEWVWLVVQLLPLLRILL